MNREGMPKYLAAEMCQTMNDHWGFGKCDLNYKSLPEMIETLCACRKVGANFLLNVGPEGDGKIPDMQKTIIEQMGVCIEKCGQSIYRGKPSDIKGEFKNFALEADGKAYLYIHGLNVLGSAHVIVAGGGLGFKYFKNVKRKVKSAKWTDDGEVLDFVQHGDHLWVNATGFPYGCNYVVRVVELEFED
jgi:alpha-L-fucosidase